MTNELLHTWEHGGAAFGAIRAALSQSLVGSLMFDFLFSAHTGAFRLLTSGDYHCCYHLDLLLVHGLSSFCKSCQTTISFRYTCCLNRYFGWLSLFHSFTSIMDYLVYVIIVSCTYVIIYIYIYTCYIYIYIYMNVYMCSYLLGIPGVGEFHVFAVTSSSFGEGNQSP